MIFERTPDRPTTVSTMRYGTHPADSDVTYEPDELEFLKAVEAYQRANRRKFPTFVEILDIVRSLGYRKVEPPAPLPPYRDRQPQ